MSMLIYPKQRFWLFAQKTYRYISKYVQKKNWNIESLNELVIKEIKELIYKEGKFYKLVKTSKGINCKNDKKRRGN